MEAGAWRSFIPLTGLTVFPAIGAVIAAVTNDDPLRWVLAIVLVAATVTLVIVTVRRYRREEAAKLASSEKEHGSTDQTGGEGFRRDWLDRIAPVGKGTYRETGGGLILFGVVGLGLGLWMLIGLPFWQQLRHLPAGPLGILAALAGVYFLLLAVNVFRRTPK